MSKIQPNLTERVFSAEPNINPPRQCFSFGPCSLVLSFLADRCGTRCDSPSIAPLQRLPPFNAKCGRTSRAFLINDRCCSGPCCLLLLRQLVDVLPVAESDCAMLQSCGLRGHQIGHPHIDWLRRTVRIAFRLSTATLVRTDPGVLV